MSSKQIEWVTKENWESYRNETSHACLIGYLVATEALVAKVNEIVAQSKDYQELKQELTTLLKERNDFQEHVCLQL